MSTRSIVVAICAVLLLGVAATQAPAKKHKHAVKMVYTSVPILTAPGDVGSGIAFCPGASAVTGGGTEYVTGIATVEMGLQGNGYYALVDNFNSTLPSQVNVQVACTAGTSKAKARPLSRAQIKASVASKAEALKAAHIQAAK